MAKHFRVPDASDPLFEEFPDLHTSAEPAPAPAPTPAPAVPVEVEPVVQAAPRPAVDSIPQIPAEPIAQSIPEIPAEPEAAPAPVPQAAPANVYGDDSFYGEEFQMPKRRRIWPIALALLVALLGVGGYFWLNWWNHRPVDITVNGETVTMPLGSSLQEVFDEVKPAVSPGNLVSVTGAVLKQGEGNPLTATLDGQELTPEGFSGATISGGESISFDNGSDLTEEYTTEIKETQPKIEFRVKEGTGEQGYDVQRGVVQYVYQWGKVGKQEIRTGSISGEKADGDTIQELQNCVVMIQDIHPDNGEKLVALTFDDGPTYYTEQYMEILKRYEIPATFNMIGEQVSAYSGTVKANLEAGNELAGHTWSHPQLTTLDKDALRSELSKTTDVIRDAAGVTVTQIRPPYGSLDEDVWMKSNGLLSVSVFWTHDSEDWKQPGVDTMVSYCTSWMEPGSVILMHDGGGPREQDLEALPRIIEAWKDAGYKFVTMEELLRSDSSIPEEIISGQVTMPEDAVWPTERA